MIASKRFIQHLIFWLVACLFLTFFVGEKSDDNAHTFFFVGLMLPIATITSYTFNYVLFPKYLFKEKYLKFTLYAFLCVTLSIYAEALIIVGSFIFLANYELNNMIPGTANIITLGAKMYLIILLSAVLYLMRRALQQKNNSEPVAANPTPEPTVKQSEPIVPVVEEQTLIQPLIVRVNRESVKVEPEQLRYIESMDNYVKLHLEGKTLVVKERISHLAKKLPPSFYRIHRSFLINSNQVDSFTKEHVQIQEAKLPISRTYKKEVIAKLEGGLVSK